MADAPLITLVTDFAAAGDFEKKHTPFVTLEPQGDTVLVNIAVGHEVSHPNEAGHYITFIELYAGTTGIARFDFSPEVTSPRVSVPVSLPAGTLLRAVAHCNLHGWWGFEITI
ncbi:MAG TPA: desulfoferrodoxin family protein [Coriobacteriia bacterium]